VTASADAARVFRSFHGGDFEGGLRLDQGRERDEEKQLHVGNYVNLR
jgi:hypothetical protein